MIKVLIQIGLFYLKKNKYVEVHADFLTSSNPGTDIIAHSTMVKPVFFSYFYNF